MKVRAQAPASSANLGPGFDVLALALDLWLDAEAREAHPTRVIWTGTGSGEVQLDDNNLIVRAAQEPFNGWARPLRGLELQVRNAIPIGRGLGSSAAAIIAGIGLGSRLRAMRLSAERMLQLALGMEGHGDNLAAALYGGFCVAILDGTRCRVHRLAWPSRWKAVIFVPDKQSPTQELRTLLPDEAARSDAVFNMGRVAEWVLAVRNRDGRLLRGAMEDRLHQPARASAYTYLQPMIRAALEAGALGAALSGAGGGVIAIVDRSPARVAAAFGLEAQRQAVRGSVLRLRAVGGRRFR